MEGRERWGDFSNVSSRRTQPREHRVSLFEAVEEEQQKVMFSTNSLYQ